MVRRSHPTKRLVISGEICRVDEKIVDLVDAINKFKHNGKQMFRTTMSCQENLGLKGHHGGETWIDLEYLTNESENILEGIVDKASYEILNKAWNCHLINICKDFGRYPKETGRTFVPKISIDCSVPEGWDGKNFKKDRDTAVQILKDIFNSMSK